MVTSRSVFGMYPESMLRKVVLPAPVPPEIRMLILARTAAERTSSISGEILCSSRSLSAVRGDAPKRRMESPALSIRRFGASPLTAERLLELQSISPEMLEVLSAAVRARISILISGGTGAGKTTFLNMLSGYIPNIERLVTIEDAAELQIQQANIVRLETRPSNVEGKGAVYQRQLLINSLRMRPDRIIIGEVRGDEAFDMLQAMNTGHEGSMTTIHANTCLLYTSDAADDLTRVD